MGRRRNAGELLERLAAGRVRSTVGETYPLEHALGAIATLSGRGALGKFEVLVD